MEVLEKHNPDVLSDPTNEAGQRVVSALRSKAARSSAG